MSYEPYADEDYYRETFKGSTIPNIENDKWLRQASRQVDSLTFNRIVAKGFDNLTPYQQEIVREVICQQAEFLYENQDLLESILQNYSINGVSMGFGGSWNVVVRKGVAMKRDVYETLNQTGLTCGLLR